MSAATEWNAHFLYGNTSVVRDGVSSLVQASAARYAAIHHFNSGNGVLHDLEDYQKRDPAFNYHELGVRAAVGATHLSLAAELSLKALLMQMGEVPPQTHKLDSLVNHVAKDLAVRSALESNFDKVRAASRGLDEGVYLNLNRPPPIDPVESSFTFEERIRRISDTFVEQRYLFEDLGESVSVYIPLRDVLALANASLLANLGMRALWKIEIQLDRHRVRRATDQELAEGARGSEAVACD